MEEKGTYKASSQGLYERLLREVLRTPPMKELILLQLKDIDPDSAPGLVSTLLWEDPGVSLSLIGALPDFVNWLVEFLLELGRQFGGLPEPLLKDFLGGIGSGLDQERLKQLPEVYGPLLRRILIGEDKTPDEVRATIISALNSALAAADRLTLNLEDNREEIARHLAQGWRELDKTALRGNLRRIGVLAVAAARPPGEKAGGKAPKAVLAVVGGIAALLGLRAAARRIRSPKRS